MSSNELIRFYLEPPQSVIDCTVKNQTINSFYLTCKPGDNGGMTQVFFLEVYDHNVQTLHCSITSEVPQFLVDNLPHSTKFTVNVVAANKKARSPSVSLTTYTIMLPTDDNQIDGE